MLGGIDMNKFEFTPDDFDDCNDIRQIAYVANAKLQQLIEAAPIVYGNNEDGKGLMMFEREANKYDTHTARLINITPIVKDECKHEPEPYVCTRVLRDAFSDDKLSHFVKCVHCEAELLATVTWSVKGDVK